LGPEGPDALGLRVGADEPQDLSSLPQDGIAGRYRPYFENYTVDASIFEPIFDRFTKMILIDH
jgi:hypothetical protein